MYEKTELFSETEDTFSPSQLEFLQVQKFQNLNFLYLQIFFLIYNMSTSSVDQLLARILSLSQTSPLGLAERHGYIFTAFSCVPIISPNEQEMGMWGKVNKSMDGAYGSDVPEADFKERLKSGKYGLECLLGYINKCRKHHTWKPAHDSLISIKLDRIINGLISRLAHFFNSSLLNVLCPQIL